jgi:hypothetical protein
MLEINDAWARDNWARNFSAHNHPQFETNEQMIDRGALSEKTKGN